MPDITIEHDTSYVSDMLVAIGRTNVISDFCVEYFDRNRSKMSGISTTKSLDAYLDKDNMFDKFLGRLQADSISHSQADLVRSGKYLNKVLRYQIASYCLDLNAANAILLEDDPYMEKAREVLGK